MTSQTITIPAREVRPGDVLFGMTVFVSTPSAIGLSLWRLTDLTGFTFWLHRADQVTVERPVPSDPIGTVRAQMVDGLPIALYRKFESGYWHMDVDNRLGHSDTDVADFPILWKPGMPIPSTEMTA